MGRRGSSRDDQVLTPTRHEGPLAAMSSSPAAGLSRRPLMEVFAQVPDPRDPRGVRHDLATVLTLAQTAVLAGARTLLAIAEWTHDAARDTLSRIGISPDQALPSESTIRRTLRPDREGEPADPARGVQGAALERRARQDHQRPQPRPPGPPHDQGRAGPRLDRIPRRRPDHPTPPNPNDQGTQDNRGRLRHLLTGHDPGSTGHRRHLDPRSLGHREPALGSGRHLRRGPPPAAHRQRTTSHGHPPQHSHQPSPPSRTHQDRHRSTTSWSAHQPVSYTHLTLPTKRIV